MRIRKRHVLFSSPHFPVTPPSDPHLNRRSPVVVQLGDATTTAPEPSSPVNLHQQQRGLLGVLSLDRRHQPSDQPFPPINGWDDPSGIGESGAHRQHSKQDPSEDDGRREESTDSEEKKSNHSRKGRIFGSQTLPPSNPSSTQDERWCEEEKAIPFKKRRGSFENGTVNNTGQVNGKKMKAKMKTKMNKKCSSTQNDDEDDGGEEKAVREAKPNVSNNNNSNGGGGGGGKKRARGSALMEGSRCSRVNGRGWRCCQQTLVGYSLCEHHLGKGRLRSMTSVRSRSTSVAASSTTTAPTNKVVVQQDEPSNHHHDPLSSLPSPSSSSSSPENHTKCIAESDVPSGTDEKKPMIITKKRMKLGMVKARSISSLLGQTNTTGIAVAHESNK